MGGLSTAIIIPLPHLKELPLPLISFMCVCVCVCVLFRETDAEYVCIHSWTGPRTKHYWKASRTSASSSTWCHITYNEAIITGPSPTVLWMDVCHFLTGLIASWEFNALNIKLGPKRLAWHLHMTLTDHIQPIKEGEQWGFHGAFPVELEIYSVGFFFLTVTRVEEQRRRYTDGESRQVF